MANSQDLLKDMPESTVSNNMLNFDKTESSRILEIEWNPAKDTLQVYNLVKGAKIKFSYKKIDFSKHFSNIRSSWSSGSCNIDSEDNASNSLET